MRKIGIMLALALTCMALGQADEVKVSGLVKGKPTATTFTLANRKGMYTVTVGSAPITKAGASLPLSSLTGGSNVSVFGTVKDKDISASRIMVNYLRAGKSKTKNASTAKRTKKKHAVQVESVKSASPIKPPTKPPMIEPPGKKSSP